MAKKTTKPAATRVAAAPVDGVPPVDPIPTTAPAKASKPRATAVPRAAKPAAAAPAVTTAVAAVSDPSVTESMIAERAYHKWIAGEPGDHYEHWISAERELRGR